MVMSIPDATSYPVRRGSLTAAIMCWTFATAHAQNHAEVHNVTLPQIRAVEAAKADRSPAQQKMSSHLVDAIAKNRTGMVAAGAPHLHVGALSTAPEGVVVDIRGTISPELAGAIRSASGRVINQFPALNSMRAAIPLNHLESIASRPDVISIQPAVKAQHNFIASAQEGAIAHMALEARTAFGLTGNGVKIGVISDSINDSVNSEAAAFAAGALDSAHVVVIKDVNGDEQSGMGIGGSESGEGLAMLEIVHALAPDAQLYFATGDGSNAQMATNIYALANAGCDIIVDDLTYYNESPFQPGVIGKAVDDVSNKGVLYFSSARNSGNLRHNTAGTWEGDFHDGGPAGRQYAAAGPGARVHEFDGGVTLNTIDEASMNDRVDLFWADPLGHGQNGYDLFLVNSLGQVVDSSTTTFPSDHDPYQSIESVHQGDSIVIVKAGTAQARFLHIDVGRAVLRHSTQGSVRGHNASEAENAFSVAAKRVPNPAAAFTGGTSIGVENFSSDGPRRVFFDAAGNPITPGNFSSSGGKVLQKPDITAADGVSTTLPPTSGLNPFLGTSAAAPHAAAIAALLLSCEPRPSPSKVRQALEHSALGIDGDIPNVDAGYGIVMASTAVQAACQGALGNPSSGQHSPGK
jgi:hypothetical protein